MSFMGILSVLLKLKLGFAAPPPWDRVAVYLLLCVAVSVSSVLGGLTILVLHGRTGLARAVAVSAFWFCLWNIGVLDASGVTRLLPFSFWLLSAASFAACTTGLVRVSKHLKGFDS